MRRGRPGRQKAGKGGEKKGVAKPPLMGQFAGRGENSLKGGKQKAQT